jgi:hypothetical protein
METAKPATLARYRSFALLALRTDEIMYVMTRTTSSKCKDPSSLMIRSQIPKDEVFSLCNLSSCSTLASSSPLHHDKLRLWTSRPSVQFTQKPSFPWCRLGQPDPSSTSLPIGSGIGQSPKCPRGQDYICYNGIIGRTFREARAASFLAQELAFHFSTTPAFSKAFLMAPDPAARGREVMV